ncbi:MAG: class I mannose-6-phosphate isomerase [Oscillospiraceae bacterium]|nr:class I mannose-6-phosphate isomerase [Oscillospiraceae bacterium]MDD4413123.1 class I mannose-6-phosphate isomerase [Oscillospiraceae bacterium]
MGYHQFDFTGGQLLPVKMKSNRVWRIYSGGKLLEEFCGKQLSADGFFPEDWLGSLVEANNPTRENQPLHEGLSLTEDGCLFRDILKQDPKGYLGADHIAHLGLSMGILVKLLDSAERLPIQVHPDKQKAREYFCSDYGKTEAWYIMDGREIGGEQPYILLGFREGVTREEWQTYFYRQDIKAMENSLHKISVKPGDVYLVNGGTPHAIGAGCLILEIQEPTDYTISVERQTPQGEILDDFMLHHGIGFDKMLECFHYEPLSLKKLLQRYKLKPQLLHEEPEAKVTSLVTYNDTLMFALNSVQVTGCYRRPCEKRPSLLVTIAGNGEISCAGHSISIKKGETVFMPAGLPDVTLVCGSETALLMLECLPPQINV